MSMQYIRDTYHVPARRGGRVRFDGHIWRIASATSAHLRVWRFEMLSIGEANYFEAIIHPTWRVEYLPEEKE